MIDFVRTPGFGSTLARESFSMAAYFGTYRECTHKQEWHPLIGGGLAGLAAWTCTYPIDTVRSRQMAQGITFTAAARQGTMWRGYIACAIRAVLVNAVVFYTYEKTLGLLK